MLSGTVRFVCEGGFPERFLNEAATHKVMLWGVKRHDLLLFGNCYASQYRSLRPVAKAASVRMHIVKKSGFPFWSRPLLRRKGMLVGMLLFFLLLSGFSSRIWTIRVTGNTHLSEDAILQVVRSLGVYEGGNFATVDIPQMQLTALERLPSLTWLSVSVQGSVAYVEVRERQPSEPIADTSPANVIAACDGVIVRMEVTAGQAAVKVGDAVTSGSLLISGVVDSKVGPLLKRASGTVTARTQHTVTITVPFEETVPDPTPRTILRPDVYIFGWHIPLYTSGTIEGNYTITTARHPMRAYGCPLPLGLQMTRYAFEERVCIRRTSEQALTEAYRRLSEQVKSWSGRTIESHTVTERQLPNAWELCGRYTCLEDIAVVKSLQMHEKTA